MAQASALGRCTHHLAGQQTMPSAGDAFVCSAQATHCAPRADIGWAGGSGVVDRHWRRHLGGSLPLFSGVNGLYGRPRGGEVVVFPQDTSEMNGYAGDASVPTPHPRPLLYELLIQLPPLRMVMGFSSDDAYWAVTKVALRVYL